MLADFGPVLHQWHPLDIQVRGQRGGEQLLDADGSPEPTVI